MINDNKDHEWDGLVSEEWKLTERFETLGLLAQIASGIDQYDQLLKTIT